VAIHASYKGIKLEGTFVPDFICYDKIIVELKAVRELDDVHRSQAINYAKVAGYKLALLINFGGSSLEYERFPVS
jgi:GxxExxY protein